MPRPLNKFAEEVKTLLAMIESEATDGLIYSAETVEQMITAILKRWGWTDEAAVLIAHSLVTELQEEA